MSGYQKVIIIWLDENIARSECCQLLKGAFVKMFIEESNPATFLNDNTIDIYVRNDFSKKTYWYEIDGAELHAFINEEECIQCIEEYREERIFLIVSLSLGKRVVPQIVKRFPDAFPKSTDHRLRSIYVLRYNLPAADQLWSMTHSDYVLSFQCEIDLVKKLINDIGYYFIELGGKQYDFGTLESIQQSLQHYKWTKVLFSRVFGSVDAWKCKENTSNLEKQIAQSETALRNLSYSTDGDEYILCSVDAAMSKTNVFGSYEQIPFGTTSCLVVDKLTHTQSNHFLAEPDNSEKPLLPIHNLVDDGQSSSEIRVYLQVPSKQTENFKNVQSILKYLFDKYLIVIFDVQDYSILFKANNPLIVVQCLTDSDDNVVLGKLCSLGTPMSLYLLGTEPDTVEARRNFFTRYPQVFAIMDDPKELAVKITLDITLKSRVMGERYVRSKDKERANKMFDQCIGLLNRLNSVSLNNMDHTN